MLSALFMNSLLREILNVLQEGGIGLDPADDGQLAKAIAEIVAKVSAARWGWGVPADGVSPRLQDLDSKDTPTGAYRITSQTTGTIPNDPMWSQDAAALVLRVSNGYVVQVVFGLLGSMWIRASTPAWTTWLRSLTSADVQAWATNATPNRLMRVGAFGLGGVAPDAYADYQYPADFNAIDNLSAPMTVYRNMVNGPTGPSSTYYTGILNLYRSLSASGCSVVQVFHGYSTQTPLPFTAVRYGTNPAGATSWTPWDRLLTSQERGAGLVSYHAGRVPPKGHIQANGAAVAVATYPELATAIYFGDADNGIAPWGYRCSNPASPSTSRSITGGYIVVPDLRAEVIRGFDDGRGVDVGRQFGSLQLDAMQNVTGKIQSRSAASSAGAIFGSSGVFAYAAKSEATNSAPIAFDASFTNTDTIDFNLSRSARTATETRMRNMALLAVIRV